MGRLLSKTAAWWNFDDAPERPQLDLVGGCDLMPEGLPAPHSWEGWPCLRLDQPQLGLATDSAILDFGPASFTLAGWTFLEPQPPGDGWLQLVGKGDSSGPASGFAYGLSAKAAWRKGQPIAFALRWRIAGQAEAMGGVTVEGAPAGQWLFVAASVGRRMTRLEVRGAGGAVVRQAQAGWHGEGRLAAAPLRFGSPDPARRGGSPQRLASWAAYRGELRLKEIGWLSARRRLSAELP